MCALVRLLLCHRQQRGSFWAFAGGSRDACLLTLFKPPWLVHPSLLLVSSFHGRSSNGEIRCLSSSSPSSPSTNASVGSGKVQAVELVWKEYFSDPSQWSDNREGKRNRNAPDFKHKVTGKALWTDSWKTPLWAKAMLKLMVAQDKFQSRGGDHTSDSQAAAQPNWLPKDNNGRSTLPTSARGLRQVKQGGDASMRMQGARTTSEAILILKNRLQQGIAIHPYTYVDVLKRCSKQKDLAAVKQVWGCITESGMDQNVHIANNLMSVFIRCGGLQDARDVFDALAKKDVVTWNVMIGGYAQHNDRAYDVMEFFRQMQLQEGVQPDEITYMSVLKACASPSALKWGEEIHGSIRDGGFESDVRVGTALLKMYAKCGSIKEARETFENLASRNVISWNVMIGAYAENGCFEEAYELLLQMKREGFQPDAITYTSILNACGSAGDLERVKEVHGHILEAGLKLDLRLANALVHIYAKSGSISDARLVFDRMEDRDVKTWTSMIGGLAQHGCGQEAYELFLEMKRNGFNPDAITFMSILNACASSAASLEWVREVHKHACEAGFDADVRVGNALVHMYAKSGSVDDARLVFNRMKERDVITWTVMIGGLAHHGCGREAYELFLRMKREGVKPAAITFLSILNVSASAGSLEWVREVHRHACEAGFDSDVRVGNALVHMYAKSGSVDDARRVFDGMGERDVITWNVIIGAYAESGRGVEAYRLLLEMEQGGFKPDAFTYVNILNPCASAGALEWVREVHKHAREAGFESDVRVGNALVHMYAKNGSIDDSRLVFHRMDERDVVTWNVMIGGLAQHGCGREALRVFREMNAVGVKPDASSFVALLSACSHAGLVGEGRELFWAMSREHGIEPSVMHCTCMVDLLARAGHLDEARLFITKMPVAPNGATWGALLGACRTYCDVDLGEAAAEELLKLEPGNASAYVVLSNIYAAADKWQEVTLMRMMMQGRGIRKEPGRSWIEVDNKIHAFVVGDSSHPEAKEIHAELNTLTEQIKAAGYRPDTRLVLHDIDEEDKEFALCSHSEKLAIAYGLMRTPKGKPVHVYKNLRVCSDCHTATKFISKVTKKEIIVRDANRFHHFKDGVCSCNNYW